MRKALKIIFIILLVIILLFALIGFSISFLVSWVWGGIRFTPDAAIEAVGLKLSEREYIINDDIYFYYDTAEHMDDWIDDVIIVKQNGMGMWYAVTNPPNNSSVYVEDTGEWVGKLMYIE